MGPRKRSKPNPKAETDPNVAKSAPEVDKNPHEPLNAASQSENRVGSSDPSTPDAVSLSVSNGTHFGCSQLVDFDKQSPPPAKTWQIGSWGQNNKSLPVAQLAKESITTAGTAASNAVASARASTPSPLRSSASYLARHAASSSRSLPLGKDSSRLTSTTTAQEEGLSGITGGGETQIRLPSGSVQPSNEKTDLEGAIPSSGSIGVSNTPNKSIAGAPDKPSGENTSWLAWFSNSDVRTKEDVQDTSAQTPDKPPKTSESIAGEDRINEQPDILSSTPGMAIRPDERKSWFGIWNTTSKVSLHEHIRKLSKIFRSNRV